MSQRSIKWLTSQKMLLLFWRGREGGWVWGCKRCKQKTWENSGTLYIQNLGFAPPGISVSWWIYQMDSSALLAFVRGIHRSPVNSPHKGQWRRALMFSVNCALNKWLSEQPWGWWFETPSRSLWRYCNVHMFMHRSRMNVTPQFPLPHVALCMRLCHHVLLLCAHYAF